MWLHVLTAGTLCRQETEDYLTVLEEKNQNFNGEQYLQLESALIATLRKDLTGPPPSSVELGFSGLDQYLNQPTNKVLTPQHFYFDLGEKSCFLIIVEQSCAVSVILRSMGVGSNRLIAAITDQRMQVLEKKDFYQAMVMNFSMEGERYLCVVGDDIGPVQVRIGYSYMKGVTPDQLRRFKQSLDKINEQAASLSQQEGVDFLLQSSYQNSAESRYQSLLFWQVLEMAVLVALTVFSVYNINNLLTKQEY